MTMRIVIVGASRFGVATTEQLLEGGHEVVLIDRDEERLHDLSEHLDCGMVHGDGSLPSVQREAWGDGADALVLLTNVDDVNILAATVGRSVGFPRVVPQIVRPELLSVCEELGLENLITPHATVARSIVRALEDEDDTTLDLRFYRGVSVLARKVGPAHAGKQIAELNLPERARVVGVTRGEEEEFVFGDTELAEGDRLVLVVADDAREAAETCLDSG